MRLTNHNVENMDVNMLMSLVNQQLRNEHTSLHSLCSSFELQEEALIERLKKGGFEYGNSNNQFHHMITK